MTDAALGEEKLPSSAPSGWRAQLEVEAQLQWRVLRRHPWLARAMSVTRPRALPNAIAHAEWVLRALDGHGLDAASRMHMHIILHGFIKGITVNLETEAEAVSETGMSDDEWMRIQEADFTAFAASGRYPAFASVLLELSSGFDLDFEALFEQGLRAILDGFARIIERTKRRL